MTPEAVSTLDDRLIMISAGKRVPGVVSRAARRTREHWRGEPAPAGDRAARAGGRWSTDESGGLDKYK